MSSILITGSSRGIGAATALLAAKHYALVYVNYRFNADAAHDVVSQIENAGGNAVAIQGDVAREDEVMNIFKQIDRHDQPLTALVNNAGILEMQSKVQDMQSARLIRVINANIISCFLCAREAIRRMSTDNGGKGGAIVNVSSVAARTGSPGEYVDYAASKAAVDAFTIGLSKEVAAQQVRVNAVRPGFIYTDIHASGGEPGRVDRVKSSVPMLRGGHPEEVAKAILWLLSEEASFTTGSFIDVTGGR